MPPVSLAIIGAGFSAVSVLRQLADAGLTLGSVTLFDGSDTWGTGLAYGPAAANALLNTRATDLGISPTQTLEFADWLGFTGSNRAAFLPRKLYGHYLRDALSTLQRHGNFPINTRAQMVTSIEATGAGFVVHTDTSADVFDRVILATGPMPATPLRMLDSAMHSCPRYIDNPWRDDWIKQVAPSARIAILGTGLSMIDHAQRLRAHGVVGPMLALSRHGLLPRVHLPQPGASASLSIELLAAIDQGNLRTLLRTLRADMAAAPSWQAQFDALRPKITTIWKNLNDTSRRTFLRHLRSYWEVHRHRMAPALHAEISQWIASGWLQLHAATIQGIVPVGETIDIQLHPRGQPLHTTLRVDWVLRATGIDGPLVAGASPLYDSLLEQKLVKADVLGLGLMVDERQCVLAADGKPVPGLYALGAMARGRLWEATAIPELRQDAWRLVEAMLAYP